ncbi:hypothetical protein ACF0H5_008044 [Mactra antiquata]
MSTDLNDDDSNVFDYKYVIGFTENQYSQNDEHLSPTPSDHHIGYTSLALDYAERSNRGEHRNFMDHSFHLDKKKRYSVGKIHNSILDLMFEQTERIKSVTPCLSKSAMELYRSDSVLSHTSDVSGKTSSSLPLIEVQQLPPMASQDHLKDSFHSHDLFFGLPGLKDFENKNKKTMKSGNAGSNQKRVQEEHKFERNWTSDQTHKTIKESSNVTASTKGNTGVRTKLYMECTGKENKHKKVNFSRENTHIDIGRTFANVNSKTKNISNVVVMNTDARRKNKCNLQRKLSFCQSSYHERAERERMNNVRRRHASQTKLGPLDFNKLKRQLSIGARSYTCLI